MAMPDVQIVELPCEAEPVLQGSVEEQARTFVERLFERVKSQRCDERMLEFIRTELVSRFREHVERIFVKAPGADRMVGLGLFNGEVNESEFEWRFGFKPQQDDLHRVNCDQAGAIGHYLCGICPHKDQPKFLCVQCLRAIGETQ